MKKIFLLGSIVILLFTIISYNYFDLDIAIYFKNSYPTFLYIFKLITKLGYSTWILITSILVFLIYRKTKKNLSQKALFIFSSVAISGLIVDVLKIIFSRARPKLYFAEDLYAFHFLEFKTKAAYYSFPSGHSSTALSFAFALSMLFPKYRVELLLIGVVVAFSRVVVTAHYLSDILAGGLIGIFISYYIYEKYFKARITNI